MKQELNKSKWALIESGLSVAMPALSLMLLAKLLTPADYGVFGIAFAILAPIWILVESFFSDYLLLQHDDEQSRALAATAYGTTLLGTGILIAILFALAPWLVPTNSPQAIHTFRVLALGLILPALSSVPQALVFRAANFKALAARTLIGRLVSLSVAAVLAWKGKGAWALVAVQLLNAAITTGATLVAPQGRIRPTFQPSLLLPHSVFLLKINVNNALAIFSRRVFLIVAARVVGLDTLGLMEMATRIVDMVNSVFSGFAKRLALPIFMKRGLRDPELSQQYWRLTLLTTAMAMVVYVTLIAGAPWLLGNFLGAKWHDAGVIAQFLSVAAGLQALRYFSFDLANMQFKPGVNLMCQSVAALIYIAGAFTITNASATSIGQAWVVCTLAIVATSSLIFAATGTLRIWAPGWRSLTLVVVSSGVAMAMAESVLHAGLNAVWAMAITLAVHLALSYGLANGAWRALKHHAD